MAISFCGKRFILTRNKIYYTPKRKNGYIILLPEIGEDLPDKDPLLKADGFPEFNTFTIERAIAAVGKLSVLFEQGIQTIEKNIEGRDDVDIINEVIDPIEELKVPLETTWGIAKSLYFGNQSLMPKKHFQCIHTRMIRASALKHISRPIYKACKRALQDDKLKLTPEQRRLVGRYELEGRLNGLAIEKQSDIDTLSYLSMKIFTKRDEMSKKVEVGSLFFKSTITNPNIVKDFPEDFLRATAPDPKNPRQGPWIVNLQPNIISGFLEYCPNRDLRLTAWRAKVNVCSIGSEHSLQTSSNLEDIRDYRMRMAKIIGYKTYAHMSMETKLSGSLDNVYGTMDDLLATARPEQEKEIEELTAFARDRGFDGDMIRQWDIDYWIRKHRRNVLNFKDEILHQYFPLPHVLKKLFELIERLFNVQIVEGRKPDVWHGDVKFFDVIDLNGSGEPIANLYLDPYARGGNKLATRHTSWIVPIRQKSKIVSTTPLISVIFNFRPPVGDVPSLLSFQDVVTLFYEVGNALQYLLSRVDYSDVAGMSNVEWEAINVSGNFMVHWLYEPKIIQSIATHYKTNEPMPDEQIESIKKIKSHMAGYKLSKELYYGRLDLQLYELPDFWVPIVKYLWKKHFVMPYDKYDSHITSWLSIFVDDLGASYYSRLWSQIIAADIYSTFQELPKNNSDLEKETSMRFRNTFLSLGGSVPASTVFRQFKGRDPNTRALLKHLRLKFTKDDNAH